MKVNLYRTEQVSDEQRVQIACVNDGAVSKRKATRDELKAFLWENGAGWEQVLWDAYSELSGEDLAAAAEADDDADEDLLGADDADDDDDLESLL